METTRGMTARTTLPLIRGRRWSFFFLGEQTPRGQASQRECHCDSSCFHVISPFLVGFPGINRPLRP